LKVLMFGWEFPPIYSGGLGTACLGLTKNLAQLGVEIKFVLPKIEEKMPHDFLSFISANNLDPALVGQINIIQLDSPLSPYLCEQSYSQLTSLAGKPLKGSYGQNLINEVYRYASFAGILADKEDFDLIHCHDWMTFPAGINAKRLSGKKLVLHVHATEFDRCGENGNPAIIREEQRGLNQADEIIAVSERTKNILIEKYKISPEKINVIYNAVEKNTYPLEIIRKGINKDPIVLFLGRITFQKGPEYFVQLAKRVLKEIKNVRFVMAGTGDMGDRIVELAASMGMVDRFHFTGFLDEKQREKMLAMADIFVMPSVSEPFGITPLEAMKYNTSIIISKQSGVAEILDHVFKVDFWDIEQMSSMVIKLLKDKLLKEETIKKNKKALDGIDWMNSAKKVHSIYKKSLEGSL